MNATYMEPDRDAEATSYAVLFVPPRSVMRKKGYDPDHLNINGREAHPLSFWKTYSLSRGTTYKEAVDRIQDVNNSKPWGMLKARLHFSDGTEEIFERTIPSDPSSLQNVKTYNPNGVFRSETLARSSINWAKQKPRLKPIVDERGHHLGKKLLPRTFAPEVLYRDCPPPVHSQAGFDFTPVSYNAFLLRPEDPPEGVRQLQSNFMHKSNDFRPRSYLRDGPANSRHCHCGEVFQVGDYTMDLAQQGKTIDHRNRLIVKKTTAIGTLMSNSTLAGKRNARHPRFPCATTKQGEPLLASVSNRADSEAAEALSER